MHALPPTVASRHPRAGLSLLEVLVACGILAVGLASVSALLPAASARLGQATQQDRAGLLAANARAECVNRGLVAADIFSSSTTACVFGELAGVSGPGIAGPSAVLAQRTGTSAFRLVDDPAFRWGGMLARTGTAVVSAAPGLPYTLSIAVFSGSSTRATISLTNTSTSPRFQLASGDVIRDEANRRRFLPACSHVLTLTNPPRWVRVTSSWTMPRPLTSGTSFVVLDPNPQISGTLNVIGFDGLLRVDQYPVTLD